VRQKNYEFISIWLAAGDPEVGPGIRILVYTDDGSSIDERVYWSKIRDELFPTFTLHIEWHNVKNFSSYGVSIRRNLLTVPTLCAADVYVPTNFLLKTSPGADFIISKHIDRVFLIYAKEAAILRAELNYC
jgi:hypothetical protein